MNTPDLSILIPARNEMFLVNTIQDLLQNIRGNTEILVGLDGEWSEPGIDSHPRVKILYVAESIGQRAMTNQLCRMSKAKYVMKIDAHCSVQPGFDVEMVKAFQELPDGDNVTMVPAMSNLHAFDWVCPNGHRRYQGPTDPCNECGAEMTREIVWKRNMDRPISTSYRFDNTLHFQYFPELKRRQVGDLPETMSIQGSCFMLTREKYWELDICDEAFGSWGQQGVEVACKTWLSGGRVVCNTRTMYLHLFRTQGRDFGFPYDNPADKIEKARKLSRDLFLKNTWPKAIHSLQWLLDKFAPVPGWDTPSKGIIFYTDSLLDEKIAKPVRENLKNIMAASGTRIVSSSLKPLDFGDNFAFPNWERGPLTMFKQILKCLEELKTDIVYFCEHDVLYHRSHFDFMPTNRDTFYYNTNVWKLKEDKSYAVRVNDCRQVSGLVGYREELIKHYKERIELCEKEGFSRNMGYEPGTNGRIPWKHQYKSESFKSRRPNVDIRHNTNLTANRWSPEEFRNKHNADGWKESDNIPGWGPTKDILK